MKKYHQGKYHCKNPQKYIGNPDNIIFRSGLEHSYMHFFDNNPSIIAWGSEELTIPYFYPVDKSWHKYFPDFAIKIKKTDGSEQKLIVEIKPEVFLSPPKKPKRLTRGYMYAVNEFIKNQSKWKFAREWCDKNGFVFKLLTEQDLKRKK